MIQPLQEMGVVIYPQPLRELGVVICPNSLWVLGYLLLMIVFEIFGAFSDLVADLTPLRFTL